MGHVTFEGVFVMTETLTQTELSTQRRQKREAEITTIIERAPHFLTSDRDRLADLIDQTGADPADIDRRIEQRIDHRAHAQRLDGLRAKLIEITAEAHARQCWQDAFGPIESLDQKLDRLADGALAVGCDDPLLHLTARPELVSDYLHARGWIQMSMHPAIFKRNAEDDRGLVAAIARDRQFVEDLSPLRDGLNSCPHSITPPDTTVDDGALDSELAALTARLESLPPIDTHAARLVRIAQAAVTLYVHQPREAAPINRAQSVLRSELPKIQAIVQQRLSMAAQRAVFGKKE
jgi:hypothetical protein